MFDRTSVGSRSVQASRPWSGSGQTCVEVLAIGRSPWHAGIGPGPVYGRAALERWRQTPVTLAAASEPQRAAWSPAWRSTAKKPCTSGGPRDRPDRGIWPRVMVEARSCASPYSWPPSCSPWPASPTQATRPAGSSTGDCGRQTPPRWTRTTPPATATTPAPKGPCAASRPCLVFASRSARTVHPARTPSIRCTDSDCLFPRRERGDL